MSNNHNQKINCNVESCVFQKKLLYIKRNTY